MDNAPADTEDARQEAYAEAGDNTNPFVIGEVRRQFVYVYRRFAAAVDVHDGSHEQEEDAEVEVQHGLVELVHDIGAKEGTGQGGQSKGNSRLEIHPLLADISKRSRQGIGHDDDQRGARNLCGSFKEGMGCACRQKQDENGDADKAAADTHECAEGAYEQAQ